jgi:hypothetical protein
MCCVCACFKTAFLGHVLCVERKNDFTDQWGTERGVLRVKPPLPPKLQSFNKAEPISQVRGIYIRNNPISIWVSLI